MLFTRGFVPLLILAIGVIIVAIPTPLPAQECQRCKPGSGSVQALVTALSTQQTSEIFYHGIDGDVRGTFDFSDLAGTCLLTERDQAVFQKNCVIQKRRGKMAPWTEVMSRRRDKGFDVKGNPVQKDCEVFINHMAKNYCIDNPRRTSFYWKVAQRNLDFKKDVNQKNFVGICEKKDQPISDKSRTETPYARASNQLQFLTCPSGKRVEIEKHAFRAAIAVARTVNAEAGICVDLDEKMKPSSRQFEMVARVLMNRADDCANKAKNNNGSDLRRDFCQTPGDKQPMLAKQNNQSKALPGYVPWLEEVVAKHGAFDPWRDPQYSGGPNSPLALFTALCPPTTQNANLFRSRGLVDIWDNINAVVPDDGSEEESTEEASAEPKPEERKPAASAVDGATDRRFNYAVGLAMEMVYCKDDFMKRTDDFAKATYFVHGKNSIPAHLVRENRLRVSAPAVDGVPVIPQKRAGMCEVYISEANVHEKCDFTHLTAKERETYRSSIMSAIQRSRCTKENLKGFSLPPPKSAPSKKTTKATASPSASSKVPTATPIPKASKKTVPKPPPVPSPMARPFVLKIPPRPQKK